MHAALPLTVSITDTYDPTREFQYQPGSTVVLNCTTMGAFEPVVYQWTSSCSGDCFVLDQESERTIAKSIIHSIDAGNHTCTVTDDVGQSESSTVEMLVVGMFQSGITNVCTLKFKVIFYCHSGYRHKFLLI